MTDRFPMPDLSRRTLLRWSAAAGAASVVPGLLTGCEPTAPLVGPPAPDPSLAAVGFEGGLEREVQQGGWCWFQRPRATIGAADRLWFGSSVGGTFTAADGTVELTGLALGDLHTVDHLAVAKTQQDDHTSPGVLALGRDVFVAWSLHHRVDYLEVARHHPGQALAIKRIRRPDALKDPGRGMAYASLHLVAGNLWLLYRGEQFSWNLLTSPDGNTWTARGLVVAPGTVGQRPYLHAATDGKVLHITVTDGNPAEFRGNSVYAGVVGSDLKVRTSSGAVVGAVGPSAPKPSMLTKLLVGSAGSSEETDTDHWLADLAFVANRPTGILVTRDPWPAGSQAVGEYRHRYTWIRGGPTGWRIEPLAIGGSELRTGHPDYTGLAAQDPTEATRVVVSTNVHPLSGDPLVSSADGRVHYELFEGRRLAAGSWTWTPLTSDSVEDNIRPVIAAGAKRKVLAWMRGNYWSWTAFDTRIVVRRVA